MINEIQNPSVLNDKIYDAYNELYRHYSGIIFKARMSIITGIIASFGYMFKVIPGLENTPDRTTHIIIPICASLFIAGVFMVEVAYSKRFFDTIACLRKMETGKFYYENYERKHWQFSILYLYASLAFNFIWCRYWFLDTAEKPEWMYFFAWGGGVISIISMICIYFDLNYVYEKKLNPDRLRNKDKWWKETFTSMFIPSFWDSCREFHKEDK